MGEPLTTVRDDGFSLIEVMFAMFVIMVGMLATAMTIVNGIAAVFYTQEQLIAKQKAREALESVFTARSTQNVTFDQIQNTNQSGGIFLAGFQSIRGMGVDGISNTSDDAATAVQAVNFPGIDGLLGTADDEVVALTNYERKITIASVLDTDGHVDPDIRQISVEVRFQVNHIWRSVTVRSYVSRFA